MKADIMMARYNIEEKEEWRRFVHDLPELQFPADWKVKIIPPFAGALARFIVILPSGKRKSVYFDAHENIGYYGEPYWEVHPYKRDCGRCAMADTAELLRMIADESDGAV